MCSKMLNDDVISTIKEYAGITSLDIVNVFYELKRTVKGGDMYVCWDKPNITKIKKLVEWIPILYKPSKKHETCKKSHLQCCLSSTMGGYIEMSDVMIAYKLLFPIEIRNGVAMFQATEKNSKEVSKYIKQTLHIGLPLHEIQKHCREYINGISSHKLIGKCICGKAKNLYKYEDVMLCEPCGFKRLMRN